MREKVLGLGIFYLNFDLLRRCINVGIYECLYWVVEWLGV